MNEMGKRYNDLRTQGLPGKAAAEKVNKEFGSELSYGTIRGYGFQAKKKDPKAKSHTPRESKKARKQASERTAEPAPAIEIDERIKAVARQVFQEMFYGMRDEMNAMADMQDVPPEPQVITGEGKGRRENRRYTKASVTVDKVLWNLFVTERDKLRVSTGRLMDIILWRHFGKPKLSYEK
jgi:hypothetical protein